MPSVTALIFPGQGSQTADMREAVERHRPDLLEMVEGEVGEDPFARIDEGTRFAQPAILCAALAGFAALEEPPFDLAAGHSMGELGALVAAGALEKRDALRLVALRGRLMDEAGRPGDGMLALRAGLPVAAPIAERHGLAVANDNAPEQVVLSGPDAALEAAAVDAKEAGLRAMRLPVSGAFHSTAMEAAVPEFTSALADTPFAESRVPVLSGVTARPFSDPRTGLAQSLTHPVRWREVLLELRAAGATRFIETGPGRVLSGLVRRTLPDAHIATTEPEPARA